MSPDDERHGTRRGYYAHRSDGEEACAACKRAAAAAEARRQLAIMHGRPGRVDARGTRRRIQALVCLGYNWVRLGVEIGSDEVLVKRWAERNTPGAYVFRSTAERVAEVYERLSMTWPPETTFGERNAATRARNRAQLSGWVPPLAWDDIDNDPEPQTCDEPVLDEVAIERAMSGQRVGLTEGERDEVIRRMAAAGRTDQEIAPVLGVSDRTVWRWRKALGIASRVKDDLTIARRRRELDEAFGAEGGAA